ncbi:MAG TPA: LCP family protein [Mycobacterium sp.]
MIAVTVVVITGVGWAKTHNLFGGITLSQALEGDPGSTGGDQNILIMGLDSRLDEHGRPLPQDIYDALHAGDETAGGYNANVLIVVHIPAGDGPITAISIPRDDYVELAGCPSPNCKGKIKQAYGMAYQHKVDTLTAKQSDTESDPAANEQEAREAGRKAEIKTVRNLLGIPIDHFIEVTLVAFFQIAKVVEPIAVCLNEDTSDDFSGADFHKGVQQIDAAQAMAFVRQRRDVNDELMFTDLDRTRRQQAFIVSLLSALSGGGTLSSPSDLRKLLDVARQNIAVDEGFDLAHFVQNAPELTDRGISLYTLPITEFSQDSEGADINIVDVAAIREITRHLVNAESSTSTPASSTEAPASVDTAALTATNGIVLDVVNASDFTGLASKLLTTFSERGFTAGTSTSEATTEQSAITYGPGAHAAAESLATELDLTATASDSVAEATVQLTVGTDFPANDYLNSSHASTSSSTTTTTTSSASPVSTVSATATGTHAPAPTDLTRMTMNKAPCVK